MSKIRSGHLFSLIKSMRKSEKRYFKLINGGKDDSSTKYLKLFNEIDRLPDFDEERILKRNQWISRSQFSNLKAHLYKKILQSLKDYTLAANDDISIRENIDYIQLLFDRSLYQQSWQLLQKVKKALQKGDNLELHLEVLKWEKNLLPYSIGKNNQDRVQQIVHESNQVNDRITRINLLTNLSVELNAIYLRTGYLRSKGDFEYINAIFSTRLPDWNEGDLSLREKLSWFEIHLSYYSFIQDFENTHAFAKKWVELYEEIPNSSYHFEMYLRGLNHLLNSQARLIKFDEFIKTHRKLRSLANHRLVHLNENIRIRLFKYIYAHQFNGYFMVGDFAKGVALMQKIESKLEGFIGVLDKHSELILFYKIACLYFGNGNYRNALKWLNRIINSDDMDIREDVHSFARIISLITHYELGNQDVMEYYMRSTYRFLRKKEDLHLFQKHILEFIKNLSRGITEKQLVERFKGLRKELLPISESEYDKRAFVYFDIISWLESKIQSRNVGEIVKEKAMKVLQQHTKRKSGLIPAFS
ncbi:MAG: hypothetical protein KI790_08215 [Cyclobacteriaceae bacterium]|nr:hypothetical protein [Cyclobacteriaceae bacterium HetDA_MAG_MS6]